MQGRLNDGIRLGMDRADAVPVDHQVTDLVAVILPGRGAVEPARQDPFFEDKHTTYKGPVTGAPFRNGIGDFHEVRIPIGAHNRSSRYLVLGC